MFTLPVFCLQWCVKTSSTLNLKRAAFCSQGCNRDEKAFGSIFTDDWQPTHSAPLRRHSSHCKLMYSASRGYTVRAVNLTYSAPLRTCSSHCKLIYSTTLRTSSSHCKLIYSATLRTCSSHCKLIYSTSLSTQSSCYKLTYRASLRTCSEC